MKRTFVLVVSSLLGFTVLFSCKKSYDCSCHKIDGTHEHIEIKTTKSKAEGDCKAKAVGVYSYCEID